MARSVPKPSPRRFVARSVPTSSSIYRTLGSMANSPVVRKVAFDMAKKVVKKVKRSFSNKRVQTIRSGTSKWNGTSTGVYAGKFKKPRKFKNDVFTQSLKSGYKIDNEIYGRVEDPDAVFVGHSTKNLAFYPTVIVAALLRKLFSKAGYPIGDRQDEFSFSTWANSSGFKIEYVVQDQILDNTSLGAEIVIPDNWNFQLLVN